jgi:hypothetical protein
MALRSRRLLRPACRAQSGCTRSWRSRSRVHNSVVVIPGDFRLPKDAAGGVADSLGDRRRTASTTFHIAARQSTA